MNSPPVKERSRTCQAAVFVGAGRPLELRSFELPALEPGEALVRVQCCTICGSDLHTIGGARQEPTPSILGHEALGVIDSVGDPAPCDVTGKPLQPGDRTTWSAAISCGACDRCQSGLPQKCRTLAKYGHELAEGRQALSGGLAEFMLLRRGSSAVRIAPEAPAEVMCPVNCATATVAAALRTAGPTAGRNVLILGAGMLGLTAAAMARSRGAATVAVCDVSARRLERALRFGADSQIEWSAEPEELRRRVHDACPTELFDIVLELSGSPDAVEAAFRMGDVGAHIVLAGSVMKSRPTAIDPENVVRRWLSVHGVHNYRAEDLQSAVAFLTQFGSAYPFAKMVEFSYPLAEVNAAIETAVRDRPFRVAVRP
jgi:alcohol dehydrogenase